MRRSKWYKDLAIDILTGVVLGILANIFIYFFLVRLSQIGRGS